MSFCPNGTERYWRFERFDFAGQARILGRFGSSWSGLASAWRFIRFDFFARTSVPRFCRSLWAIVARGSRCAGRMSFSTPPCRLGRLLWASSRSSRTLGLPFRGQGSQYRGVRTGIRFSNGRFARLARSVASGVIIWEPFSSVVSTDIWWFGGLICRGTLLRPGGGLDGLNYF